MIKRTLLICIYILAISSIASAQQGASISFEQYLSLRQAGNQVISPDGKWISFLADRGDKAQIHVMRKDGEFGKYIFGEEIELPVSEK